MEQTEQTAHPFVWAAQAASHQDLRPRHPPRVTMAIGRKVGWGHTVPGEI